MKEEEEKARQVVSQVRRATLRQTLFVVAALSVAATIVISFATVGLIRLPLNGVPIDGNTWALDVTQADRLLSLGYDGSGVTICLVDTGIDLIHPDLASAHLVVWKDLVNGETYPYDDSGHGTAMAGLIAARGRLTGVASGASLIIVKALGSNGTGSSDTVGKAIRFCMDPNKDGDTSDGADIISLSLGSQTTPFKTNAAALAAEEAIESGIFVVSSAGNDGREDDGEVGSPADEPLVVAVGSINRHLEIAAFSSRGDNGYPWNPSRADPNKKPELVLPGVGLITTSRTSSYSVITGTSASAGLFSGLLALLLEANPGLLRGTADTVLRVKAALMHTAERLDDQDTPHDDWYGYGLVQAYAAHVYLASQQPA